MNSQEQIMAIVTVVRTEVQGHLKPILELLNEDLERTFTEFNQQLEVLRKRLDLLDGGAIPKDPNAPGVEL